MIAPNRCKQCKLSLFECVCEESPEPRGAQPDPYEDEGPDGYKRRELDFDIGGEG